MSVNTQLYVTPDWSVEDIKDVLERKFETPVKIEFHDFAPDYVTLVFSPGKDKEPKRQLSVHQNSRVGGLKATLLTLRSNDEGIDILKTLAKTLGGLFQEGDTGNDFEEFERPGEGNILFVIKQALKDDPSLGSNDDGIIDYIKNEKWMDKAVWPKRAGKRDEK